MTTPSQSFAAFFSYVRRNDEHDKGRLTDFRKLLEAELWAQTGKDLQIFQDTEDIEWGDVWKERITKVLDISNFLIVIVTPGYLESQSCRFEFEYFLRRESSSGQKDLILPILYIDTAELKNPKGTVAVEISKRQWIDWRELRFVSLEAAKLNKKIESLAKRIRDMLSRKETAFVESNRKVSFPNSVTTEKHWREIWQPKLPVQTEAHSIYRSVKPRVQNEKISKITVLLESTGDIERDRRRIRTVYGTLISFRGSDRFSFQVSKSGRPEIIEFPNDTTRICPEMLERLKKLMGKESWHVEEIVDNNNVGRDNTLPY
jgi:hypothetical protein